MPPARPLSPIGSILLDARGDERGLRVSWHPEAGVVVLSVWHDNVCTASFRLAATEVPDLIDLLARGLAAAHAEPARSPARSMPA